ncbi:MAG TPA: hypothetical protein VL443_23990 [Cyclobacteriaceae bacterium]|jgi:hypothetical protein|nr:hypothetical protein [Cyclobacteriaceae bacterium]
MRLYSISKEDLLLKIKKLECENTLLRKNQVDKGKDEAYIEELKHKIDSLQLRLKTINEKYVELLELRVKKLKSRCENQKELISHLHKKLTKRECKQQ